MRRMIPTLTLALSLSALGLSGQESPRERARQTLPAAVFERIEALATEGAALGVPDEPLFSKALEGMAKRVPADRIMPAVESYALRLADARSAFGPMADVSLLIAGADALQRGVPSDALRSIEAGRGRTPMAVLVLAELVEGGVPMDRALAVLREAMQQRTREDRMLDIPAQVRRLVREGAAPHDAAEQVRRGLQTRRGGVAQPPVPPGSEPATRTRTRGGD